MKIRLCLTLILASLLVACGGTFQIGVEAMTLPPTLTPPLSSPTPVTTFPTTPTADPSPPPPFTPQFPTPALLHLIPIESDLTKPFSDIAVISFDGSYYNQLTTYGYNTDPVFSPDGQYIAYRSVPASITTLPDPGPLLYSGQYNIWVITFDGVQAWKLTDSATLRSIPSWSPDSRRVIFSEGEAGALVEVEVATQTRRELLAAGGRDPRYRPDGNGVGYITSAGGLAWMDSAGNVRALVDDATLPPLTTVHDFDWLPDGTTVVYTLADERERIEGTTIGIEYNVWSLSLAGSAPIKLAGDVHDVQVSPDGQTIAVQAGSGSGDACLVDLQTTFLLPAPDRASASLISVADFGGLPALSPDGVFYPTSKVVWVSPHQAVGQFSLTCTPDTTAPGVYVIDVNARQLRQIRHSPIP